MSQSPANSGWSLISTRYGPKAADGGWIVSRKLSQPALFALPQFADPVAVLIGPVQVVKGLLSEIVAPVGVALKELGASRAAKATRPVVTIRITRQPNI